MQIIVAYIIGLIFGIGIVISGMSNPAKVINFFDIAGSWDPSLMFVMGGALGVTMIGYRFVFQRQAPLLSNVFHSTRPSSQIDAKLIGGAAIFGVGWGISGLCPGGAIPAVGTGRYEIIIFVAALAVGIVITRFVVSYLSNAGARAETVLTGGK